MFLNLILVGPFSRKRQKKSSTKRCGRGGMTRNDLEWPMTHAGTILFKLKRVLN